MKVNVYQHREDGHIRLFPQNQRLSERWVFIGTIDLPIEMPKKMVTKEVPGIMNSCLDGTAEIYPMLRPFPQGATNIRVLYDIEE